METDRTKAQCKNKTQRRQRVCSMKAGVAPGMYLVLLEVLGSGKDKLIHDTPGAGDR